VATLQVVSTQNVSFFLRCVGESPPDRGSRQAHSAVLPNYSGHCSLHYERAGQQYAVTFPTYQQALTAATMAIFCHDHPYRNVVIQAGARSAAPAYPNATAWRQAQG